MSLYKYLEDWTKDQDGHEICLFNNPFQLYMLEGDAIHVDQDSIDHVAILSSN